MMCMRLFSGVRKPGCRRFSEVERATLTAHLRDGLAPSQFLYTVRHVNGDLSQRMFQPFVIWCPAHKTGAHAARPCAG